ISVLRMKITTPEHEVMRASYEAVRAHDARKDAEKVEKLLDKYLGSGFAVIGARDTLIALTLGQVEEMLVSASEQDVRDDLIGKDAELVPAIPVGMAGNGGARRAGVAGGRGCRAFQTDAGVTVVRDAPRVA